MTRWEFKAWTAERWGLELPGFIRRRALSDAVARERRLAKRTKKGKKPPRQRRRQNRGWVRSGLRRVVDPVTGREGWAVLPKGVKCRVPGAGESPETAYPRWIKRCRVDRRVPVDVGVVADAFLVTVEWGSVNKPQEMTFRVEGEDAPNRRDYLFVEVSDEPLVRWRMLERAAAGTR